MTQVESPVVVRAHTHASIDTSALGRHKTRSRVSQIFGQLLQIDCFDFLCLALAAPPPIPPNATVATLPARLRSNPRRTALPALLDPRLSPISSTTKRPPSVWARTLPRRPPLATQQAIVRAKQRGGVLARLRLARSLWRDPAPTERYADVDLRGAVATAAQPPGGRHADASDAAIGVLLAFIGRAWVGAAAAGVGAVRLAGDGAKACARWIGRIAKDHRRSRIAT